MLKINMSNETRGSRQSEYFGKHVNSSSDSQQESKHFLLWQFFTFQSQPLLQIFDSLKFVADTYRAFKFICFPAPPLNERIQTFFQWVLAVRLH